MHVHNDESRATYLTLLRTALDICREFVTPRYGFAYIMPLSQYPDCYASGTPITTLADFREWLKFRSAGITPKRTPDIRWRDELYGARRHLSGLFRGAYPANLLSDVHVMRAELQTSDIGKLTRLPVGGWLWELSPAEVPRAEAYLAEKRILVQQAKLDI